MDVRTPGCANSHCQWQRARHGGRLRRSPERGQGSVMSAAASEEQVGVIVVHGIGDEKPHEHLESVVRPLANGLAAKDRRVTVVDQPQAPDGEPQTWILVRSVGGQNDRLTRIGVHEAYWADINEAISVTQGLKYWLWSLTTFVWAIAAWFTPGTVGNRSRVF